MGPDEAVLFAGAVHPTHAGHGPRAAGRRAIAVRPSNQPADGSRINIHGAIDLETGQNRMIEVETVDALSTIKLLESIDAFYPLLALIHVYLDNARYQHAKLVQAWLAKPGCRIRLHFIPAYCPHLNPIERLWGHARTPHPQQILLPMRAIRRRASRLSTQNRSRRLGRVPRFRYRQFPRHLAKGFSGYGVNSSR